MKIPILFLLFFLTFQVSAQDIHRDSAVTPKFAKNAVRFDKVKTWQGKEQLTGYIRKDPESGKLMINGDLNWKGEGVPWLDTFRVRELTASKTPKRGRILLDNREVLVELEFEPTIDMRDAMSEILFAGDKASFVNSDYFKDLERTALGKIFTGKLAEIPFERQQRYFTLSNYDSARILEVPFKGSRYLTFSIPSNVIYNTIQVNGAERAAKITEALLPRVRSTYLCLGRIAEIDGLNFTTSIKYRNFVDRSVMSLDEYQIFIPYEILEKFLNADVTNQELIDGSVVLVAGLRLKVNLTGF